MKYQSGPVRLVSWAIVALLVVPLVFGDATVVPARSLDVSRVVIAPTSEPRVQLVFGQPSVARIDAATSSPSTFRGEHAVVDDFAAGRATPTAAAAADFDEDGTPDLVVGYATATGGAIAMFVGNVRAVYPAADTGAGVQAEDVEPFLRDVKVVRVSECPSFLAAGDFDADGHADVAVAALTATSLLTLSGNGHGQLAGEARVALPGRLRTFACGEIDRVDGLPDIVVGVETSEGWRIVEYAGPSGAVRAAPRWTDVGEAPVSIALGRLHGDSWSDIVAGYGTSVAIRWGRDSMAVRATDEPEITTLHVTGEVTAVACGRFNGGRRSDVAFATTTGRVGLLSPSAPDADSSNRADWEQLDFGPGSATTLVRARLSGSRRDDLIAATAGATGASILGGASNGAAGQLELDGGWVATVPMRLGPDALDDLVVLREGSLLPAVVRTAPRSNFVVVNAEPIGPGSLRDAMQLANESPGLDRISFNLPGTAPHVIPRFGGAQDAVDPVVIDGTTQPGYAGIPIVVLDGSADTFGNRGFEIEAPNCVVRGLVVNNCAGFGIAVLDGSDYTIVEGNYVGTDASGTVTVANEDTGIYVAAMGVTVGGTAPPARNVASGSERYGIHMVGGGGEDSVVQGNYVGLDASGTQAVPNLQGGIVVAAAHDILIGGTVPGSRNVVSGNRAEGIAIVSQPSDGVRVQGNLVGTNAGATMPLPNLYAGILINNSSNNTIGGTVAGAGNISCSNIGHGITVRTFENSIQLPTFNNVVLGNTVGIGASGAALGNTGVGIFVDGSMAGNTLIGGTDPGAGNVIAHTNGNAVAIGMTSSGNRFVGNSMFDNALAIDLNRDGPQPNDDRDLDGGGNGTQNWPELSTAVVEAGGLRLRGQLRTAANRSYAIHVYANPECDGYGYGEAERYLGNVTVVTDAAGRADIDVLLGPIDPAFGSISATATDDANNTSELSACVGITEVADLRIGISTQAGQVSTGGEIEIAIQVTNDGPGTARSVLVRTAVPEGAGFAEATTDHGVWAVVPATGAAGPAELQVGTLPVGVTSVARLRVSVSAPAGTVLVFEAIVSSTTTETDPADNVASLSVNVIPPVVSPTISRVRRSGATDTPFQLKIQGTGFQVGAVVVIGDDVAPWPVVRVKNGESIVIGRGSSLKRRFPKGIAVTIRVVNPDGGVAGAIYTR